MCGCDGLDPGDAVAGLMVENLPRVSGMAMVLLGVLQSIVEAADVERNTMRSIGTGHDAENRT